MNVLVTAGNTQTPVDQVRVITNVFTGKTGAQIALAAHARGHGVTLVTSHPEVVERLSSHARQLNMLSYRTFDELQLQMEQLLCGQAYDALIHCAAVSDYSVAGVFRLATGARLNSTTGQIDGPEGQPHLVDVQAGKIKSQQPELWLQLRPTPKLVDMVRPNWGFKGLLVKFKLEVGLSDEQLLLVAERSRRHSSADFMVANTYEGREQVAFLGPVDGDYQKIQRPELAIRLMEVIESAHSQRG